VMIDAPGLIAVCVAAPVILLGFGFIAFTYYLDWWERNPKQ
jgi:hypothetical protein